MTDPSNTGANSSFFQGLEAARAGNRLLARARFEQALEENTEHADGWVWLAWTTGSLDGALSCLAEALRRDPDHPIALAGRNWLQLLRDAAKSLAEASTPQNAKSEPLPVAPPDDTPDFDLEPVSLDARDAEGSYDFHDDLTTDDLDDSFGDTTGNLDHHGSNDHARWQGEIAAADATELSRDAESHDAESHDVTDDRSVEPAACSDFASDTDVDGNLDLAVELVADAIEETPVLAAELVDESPDFTPIDAEEISIAEVHRDLEEQVAECAALTTRDDDAWSPTTPVVAEVVPVPVAEKVETENETVAPTPAPVSVDAEDTQDDLSCVTRTTILAVDDSPTVRKLLAMTLEQRGYTVVTVEDGVAALQFLACGAPALIITDITMPRLDGYQLCKLVKKHERTRRIPVIMLSGKDGVFDRLRGHLVGCDDYLSKPFESNDLMQKVSKYVPCPVPALV